MLRETVILQSFLKTVLIGIIFIHGCKERKIINPVDIRYGLDPPKILTALEISSFQFYITWEINPDLYTGYIVYRKKGGSDFKELTRLPADRKFYIDPTYNIDSVYIYGLAGIADQNVSIIKSAQSVEPESEYGVLHSKITFEEHLSLSWEINVTDPQKLILEKMDPKSGEFELFTELSSDTKSIIDKEVLRCCTYTYKMSVIDQANLTYDLIPYTVEIGSVFSKRVLSTGNEYFKAILQISDDKYILVGEVSNPTSRDIRLIKINKLGDIIGINTIGTQDDDYYGASCKSHESGFILGIKSKNNSIVVMIDNDGNEIWRKLYDGNVGKEIMSIEQTLDGGYIISGSKSNVSFEEGWLRKVDENGNEEWIKTTSQYYSIPSAMPISDGDFIIAANYKQNIAGSDSMSLARFDEDGTLIWQKIKYGAIFKSIISKSNDIICIITNWHGKDYIQKFDINGNPVWIRLTAEYNDQFFSPRDLIELDDGSFLFSASRDEPPGGKIYLERISDNGDVIWESSLLDSLETTNYEERNNNLVSLQNNKVFVMGTAKMYSANSANDFKIFRYDLVNPNCGFNN